MQAANARTLLRPRSADQEVQQRLAEIDRVASQTSFNGQKMLDGSFGTAAFQVGANAGETISIGLATSMSRTRSARRLTTSAARPTTRAERRPARWPRHRRGSRRRRSDRRPGQRPGSVGGRLGCVRRSGDGTECDQRVRQGCSDHGRRHRRPDGNADTTVQDASRRSTLPRRRTTRTAESTVRRFRRAQPRRSRYLVDAINSKRSAGRRRGSKRGQPS